MSEHDHHQGGDVNGILTHTEGENWRHLLPPCIEFSGSVKKASALEEAVLAVVRAPLHQLSKQAL